MRKSSGVSHVLLMRVAEGRLQELFSSVSSISYRGYTFHVFLSLIHDERVSSIGFLFLFRALAFVTVGDNAYLCSISVYLVGGVLYRQQTLSIGPNLPNSLSRSLSVVS